MKACNRKLLIILLFSLTPLLFLNIVIAADYAVVANKEVLVSSLRKAEIQAIFLGDKTRWEDGKPIKIAVLEGGAASKAFLQNVVGKTPSQYELYWKKLVFNGKAVAPRSFDDAAALIQFVSGTYGAVGFVGANDTGSSVKTITIK